MPEALGALGRESERVAETLAGEIGLDWNSGIKFIFKACLLNPDLAPNIGAKNDTAEKVIEKWLQKYKKGYEHRISLRVSNTPNTTADPIIDIIIGERLPQLNNASIAEIKYAHRLSMSAENILGLLLEEFLAENLLRFSWHCAWGERVTIGVSPGK